MVRLLSYTSPQGLVQVFVCESQSNDTDTNIDTIGRSLDLDRLALVFYGTLASEVVRLPIERWLCEPHTVLEVRR